MEVAIRIALCIILACLIACLLCLCWWIGREEKEQELKEIEMDRDIDRLRNKEGNYV